MLTSDINGAPLTDGRAYSVGMADKSLPPLIGIWSKIHNCFLDPADRMMTDVGGCDFGPEEATLYIGKLPTEVGGQL